MLPNAVAYVPLWRSHASRFSAKDVFDAVADDLITSGDLERELQKSFRWGFEDEDGNDVPGLTDILERLRRGTDETEAAGGELGDSASAEPESNDDRASSGPSKSDLQKMERELKQIESLEDLQGLDPELVDQVLSDTEREWIEQWANMPAMFVEAGLAIEVGARLKLSPQAIRRIGQHALRQMYAHMQHAGIGNHETGSQGRRGQTIESSSKWEWGEPFTLHLARTVMNAIARQGGSSPVRLAPDDFEMLDRESSATTATVLLIDMSRSMFHNGCWDAAKRTALALDALIQMQFPRDDLEIVGFSGGAKRLRIEDLPSLTWDEFTHGTNLQEGLSLASSFLRRYHHANRHVIVITDGEPTAFTEHGRTIFEHPAGEKTYDATLREVGRLTRQDVAITTFLLDASWELIAFVDRMTRINRGRVIRAHPDDLGRYVVHDFARRQTRQVR